MANWNSHIGVASCLKWAPRRVMFAAAATNVLTFWIPITTLYFLKLLVCLVADIVICFSLIGEQEVLMLYIHLLKKEKPNCYVVFF